MRSSFQVRINILSVGNHQRCSMKNGIFRNLTKFTGKHLCQSLLFNKVAGLKPATLLKKRLCHRCFPVNFMKFLRTPFLQNTSGLLLLFLKRGGIPLLSLNKLGNSWEKTSWETNHEIKTNIFTCF